MLFIHYTQEFFFRVLYFFLGWLFLLCVLYTHKEVLLLSYLGYSSVFLEHLPVDLITTKVMEVFTLQLHVVVSISLCFLLPLCCLTFFCFVVEGFNAAVAAFFLSSWFFLIVFLGVFLFFFHTIFCPLIFSFFFSYYEKTCFLLPYISLSDYVVFLLNIDFFVIIFMFVLFSYICFSLFSLKILFQRDILYLVFLFLFLLFCFIGKFVGVLFFFALLFFTELFIVLCLGFATSLGR